VFTEREKCRIKDKGVDGQRDRQNKHENRLNWKKDAWGLIIHYPP
jgi:hypothetical protein